MPDDKVDKLELQVRYADIDSYGHVNNAVYLSYFELARIEFLKKHLPKDSVEKLGIVVARVEVDYLSEIKLGDHVMCETWISSVGRTSIVFSSLLRKNDIVAARGKITMVHVNQHGRPEPLPGYYRDLVAQVPPIT